MPLQRIRDGFRDLGGDYTYLGDQDALSDKPGSTGIYANQIATEINAHTASKGVFLVGHSRGATAVVWAANVSGYSSLKAIAILDSYLLKNSDSRCRSGEYRGCVADGDSVVDNFQVFMGKSTGRGTRFPAKGTVNSYFLNHTRLAAAPEVATDILRFFEGFR